MRLHIKTNDVGQRDVKRVFTFCYLLRLKTLKNCNDSERGSEREREYSHM